MKKRLPLEALKGFACICMLLDHIGAVFLPGYGLRIIGRLAFPIFCFLLVEGAAHTHSPGKYALRLLLCAFLSEIPFDLLFFGGFTWTHQNVMFTLLLGLMMIFWSRKLGRWLVPFFVCFFAAEIIGCDYGGWGICLIALFMATAEHSREKLLQWIGMAVIFLLMDSAHIPLWGVGVPIQLFGILAMVPIGLYSGRKQGFEPWVKWGFYLFYPLHITILLFLRE